MTASVPPTVLAYECADLATELDELVYSNNAATILGGLIFRNPEIFFTSTFRTRCKTGCWLDPANSQST